MENKHTEITRKEAIKKMGKYAAFTAVGTFAILSPLRAQNTSMPIGPPGSRVAPQDTPTDSKEQSSEFINKSQVKNNF